MSECFYCEKNFTAKDYQYTGFCCDECENAYWENKEYAEIVRKRLAAESEENRNV